jgi:hypothetical protein
MIHISWRRQVAAFLFTSVALFAWGGTPAASSPSGSIAVELDHLIPRGQWEIAGLNKLTAGEQLKLAGEITGLLGAAQSDQAGAPVQKDRTQWRSLRRHMSKDDVRKLLGEPRRVSVSRFYESWDYMGGTVIFDGKGRLDAWSEL